MGHLTVKVSEMTRHFPDLSSLISERTQKLEKQDYSGILGKQLNFSCNSCVLLLLFENAYGGVYGGDDRVIGMTYIFVEERFKKMGNDSVGQYQQTLHACLYYQMKRIFDDRLLNRPFAFPCFHTVLVAMIEQLAEE